MELRDFYNGKAFNADCYFGAHPVNGGVIFRIYAPKAVRVSLEGDFNNWGEYIMAKDPGGIHEAFIPGAQVGEQYHYVIDGADGKRQVHIDPYARALELRPDFKSRICSDEDTIFDDENWIEARERNFDRPVNIYELHAGSWRKKGPGETQWYTYAELAEPLIAYVKANGFTHIEILPLCEHPADCSWGYQVTGFFAPTARYGTPEDLKRLINACHRAGIGVIMDFVPVHFAIDAYGLGRFDGTALYEYEHDDVGRSEWGTYNFNHFKGEVRSFLNSSADYWLRQFHMDGIRMDAISRILYWQGDPNRGVNEGAVAFIQELNMGLRARHPGVMLIAEDSTNFPKVTAPVEYDGLGFDYKWDMGFMHDTLNYFKTPPEERPQHYHKLTFSMAYFYNEHYILPFSHDENVHGKATILQKMWGDYTIKFPQARAMYLWMYTHPGKKLNFMGAELGQIREWDENREQDWELLTYPIHDAFKTYFTELSCLYRETPALYNGEFNAACFEWLVADDAENSVYAFKRKSIGDGVIVILNLSDTLRKGYSLPLSEDSQLEILLDSDWQKFGGETPENVDVMKTEKKEDSFSIKMDLPPFSGKILKILEAQNKVL